MAIKPPDLLNRLPSVSELLEKPPIRALVDRWNRSVVMGGVRSFLDEVRSDIERRAAELPSIRELAERAARYVVSRQQHSLGVAINATGQLSGSDWAGTPIAEIALERMIALGREYTAERSAAGAGRPTELESLLCRLSGAQAAAAVHTYAGAVWLALAALAAERDVLVARAEIGDIDGGDSLAKLAAAAGATLKEVGATNRCSAGDYEAAASPRAALLLKVSADAYRIAGETASAELDELIAVARDRELRIVDALGGAPLADPPASINWPRRTAAASVAAGTDLVILRGDGPVGGPSCGILLGSQEVIDPIARHPQFSMMRLDRLRAVALTATIECYDSTVRGADTLPVWQCLGTSVENLRNRAERLAAQLKHVSGVASAAAVETRSPLSAGLAGAGRPSYGVALLASDGDVRALDGRLRNARFPIVGRVEGEQLVLDLRTVIPRQDKAIVDALLT
jgi:L-seryl-tRNA(Ser) seleniumtransferase